MPTTPTTPTTHDFNALRDLAIAIAEEASAIHMRDLAGVRIIDTKTSPVDAVTEVDRACEELIVRRIIEARPHDSVLGEEGASHTGTSGVHWIVNPLDGTVNYLYRRGAFAVSLGIEIDGVPSVGVVRDSSLGETFHAVLGGGAFVNDRRIEAPPATDLSRSLIGTGFGYAEDVRRAQGRILAHVIPHVRDIRRAGSAALDLCAVACGRLDGYYERGVQVWDVAGARVVATEAGATVERLDTPEVPAPTWIVGAPGIYPALRALVVAGSHA